MAVLKLTRNSWSIHGWVRSAQTNSWNNRTKLTNADSKLSIVKESESRICLHTIHCFERPNKSLWKSNTRSIEWSDLKLSLELRWQEGQSKKWLEKLHPVLK